MSSLPSPQLSVSSMPETLLPNLFLDSTLEHLSLWDVQLQSSEQGQKVVDTLEGNPLIPGVILTEGGELLGMISRRRFLEYLSRPYGLELFLKRPLTSLYRFACRDILRLSGDTLIVDAARQSLARSPELLYEPIVVELSMQNYRLLDVHQLLIAQSYIHVLATQLLNQAYQELDEVYKQLQRQASLDGLTQVANRRKFDEYLRQEWLQMERLQAPLSLILADVDFFKLYNDTYGHQQGDDCLKAIATAMSQALQSPLDFVARYGGEEFVVVLPNTDIAAALAVAEEIRCKVKAMEIAHQSSQACEFVSLSLGVATTIPGSKNDGISLASPEKLIASADLALYQAKKQGRDRVVLSSPN
ncbi:diguanylate cyclase [Oscillatoriales cyanobacterium USR001]|nr:diguanylate cyclase [Oscillatoriales cyanobacterium USR001]